MTAAIEQAVQESWPGGALHHITARARLLMAVYSGLRIMARSDLARDYMDSAKIAALDFDEACDSRHVLRNCKKPLAGSVRPCHSY
jgi:hypothetical protein